MADTQFHGLQTADAPNDWTIPGSLEIVLKAARAVFDGSGAVSAFLPALEVLSDSGSPVGTYVAGSAVAAGDSADVSFAPFLKGSSGGGSGGGIQFDTLNTGDWLNVQATGAGGDGASIELTSTGGGNIEIEQLDDGQLRLEANGNGGILIADNGTGKLEIKNTGSGGTSIHDDGAGGLKIDSTGAKLQLLGDNTVGIDLLTNGNDLNIDCPPGNVNIVPGGGFVGFFGVPAVAQAAHPTTLAQVITILQNLGLCA